VTPELRRERASKVLSQWLAKGCFEAVTVRQKIKKISMVRAYRK
jgi:hypothetical protein